MFLKGSALVVVLVLVAVVVLRCQIQIPRFARESKIRVRVGDPERIIGVPVCVDGVGLTMLAASVFQLVGARLCPVQCVCHT